MNIQIPNSIISADWLQEQLNATNLVILNGTISSVVDTGKKAETQQIPTASFFDIKKVFSVVDAPFPNTMLDVATFTQKAQKLGINKDSAIVVYDELGIYSSPRVWYLFKVMGFDNIAVLNGGFPSWKEANYAIEAKKQLSNLQLDVLGDGPLRSALMKKIVEYSLHDSIRLHGSVPLEQVAKYIRESSVLVLPSYREGVPNVLLESFASGTPVIATKVGGIPEVVNDSVGLLVDAKNVEQLTQAITIAIDKTWSQEGIIDHAQQFNWQTNVQHVLDKIGEQ